MQVMSGMDAVLWTCLVCTAPVVNGAVYTTPNFVVTAHDDAFAKQVGEAAEVYRQELSVLWTGKEMPRWSARCPIQVKAGHYGAGGATTFQFDRGEVFGWNMQVQGSEERILDSVLPHEVNHTIFACYFRRPLPRWADEGAASLIEHESERRRLKKLHEQVMNTNRKIPLKRLLPMREYPTDQQQVLTLYAEGYSLADYLIQHGDRRRYLQFLSQSLHDGWERALRDHYGYEKIEALEKDLDEWILAGSPALVVPDGQLLADRRRPTREEPIIRGQSPEWHVVLGEPGDWPRRSSSAKEDTARSQRSGTTGRSRVALSPPLAKGGNERQSRQRLEEPSLLLAE